MPLNIGPRLHALTHSLFKPRDETETKRLYDELSARFVDLDIADEDARGRAIRALALCVWEAFDTHTSPTMQIELQTLVGQLLDFEGIWQLPEIDFSEKRDTSQWWELREELNRQKSYVVEFDNTFDELADAITAMLRPFVENGAERSEFDKYAVSVQTTLLHRVSELPAAIEGILAVADQKALIDASIFERLR